MVCVVGRRERGDIREAGNEKGKGAERGRLAINHLPYSSPFTPVTQERTGDKNVTV